MGMSNVGRYLKVDCKWAALGTVLVATLLFPAGLGVAQAEPAPSLPGPDGHINVVVGGATFLDSVPDTQAVQAVTGICTLPAPAVDAMVAQVDAAGGSLTACTGRSDGDVVLAQNLPPAEEMSPVVPGTSASFGSGAAGTEPAGPDPIAGSLPTEPDNMSSEN